MTGGIVSALGRVLPTGNSTFSNPKIIQTDTPSILATRAVRSLTGMRTSSGSTPRSSANRVAALELGSRSGN